MLLLPLATRQPPLATRHSPLATCYSPLGLTKPSRLAFGVPCRVAFYSSIYRAAKYPRRLSEIDPTTGAHVHWSPYSGRVEPGVLSADQGFWDAYRTTYSWLALLAPERMAEAMQGWANAFREGGWASAEGFDRGHALTPPTMRHPATPSVPPYQYPPNSATPSHRAGRHPTTLAPESRYQPISTTHPISATLSAAPPISATHPISTTHSVPPHDRQLSGQTLGTAEV